MSDHKISEFRERAETAVTAPDADLLLYRGRALRRRRRLAPVVAVAACAAIVIGFLAYGGGDARTGQQPIDQPTVTETPDPHPPFMGAKLLGPGTYALDSMDDDGLPDATVELVGCCWQSFSGGAHTADALGTVSWGFQKYEDTIIDRCSTELRATSRRGAITQLSNIPGTVTRAPRPATKLGLTGTSMQLSIPVRVSCSSGAAAAPANLMAIFPPPTDPTVTVDVWLLEDGDRLLILTGGVRGNPSPARLESLDRTLDTLRYVPTP